MSDLTPRLGLPLMQPAQAQKHVTLNEALARLDALAQLVLEAADGETPPAEPAEGTAWALRPAPAGEWAGQGGQVALRQGGGWTFAAPAAGWRAWERATGRLLRHDGTGWVALLDGLDRLGINATAAGTDRLAVAAEAVLLSHDGADHRLKVNKAAPGDTASLVFQTGFSGRAEIGLAGSDELSLRVSADGTGFLTALTVAGATGIPDLAAGATIAGAGAYHRGNLVGAVGGSGGAPDCAAMERGSTATGDYVRFADGTQICTLTETLSVTTAPNGALHHDIAQPDWSFPVAFAAAPTVSFTARGGSVWTSVGAVGPGAMARVLHAAAALSGASVTTHAMAIGRWV